MRRRNAIHKPKPLDKVAEIIKSDAKSDLHDRQIGLTEQTRRLLDSQGIDMLGECPSEIIPEKVLKYCGDNPNSAATADSESGSVKCSPR